MVLLLIIIIVGVALNPENASQYYEIIVGIVGSIISLLILLGVCFFCGKTCGFSKQKQGQQQTSQMSSQQQVVINKSGERMRICPKCGWQNDIHSKFCGDCGYEFAKGKKRKKKK